MVRKRKGVAARVVEEVQKRAGSDKVEIGSSGQKVAPTGRRPGRKKYTPANRFTYHMALAETVRKFEQAVNPLLLSNSGRVKMLTLSDSSGRRFYLVRLMSNGLVHLKDVKTNESVHVTVGNIQLRVVNPLVASEVTCHGCLLTWGHADEGGFYYHHPSPICGDCFIRQAEKRRVFIEPTVLDLSSEQRDGLRQAFVSLKHKPAGDTEAGFIHDLYENTADKDRWLVYSDWLEEYEPFSTALQAARWIREAVAPGEFKR